MNDLDKIRALIAKYKNIDIDLVKPESTFEELELDSLDMFQILFEAEEAFNIDLVNADYENIKTVQDILNFLEDNT